MADKTREEQAKDLLRGIVGEELDARGVRKVEKKDEKNNAGNTGEKDSKSGNNSGGVLTALADLFGIPGGDEKK